MNTEKQPSWGDESRFYLPNEDARMLRKAISVLPEKPVRPVFVGGSGMILLDAIAEMPELQEASFVDISAFQVTYFQELLTAVKRFWKADSLNLWFRTEIYPQLFEHFRSRRNKIFFRDSVVSTLRDLFSIRCFFDDRFFFRVKEHCERITVEVSDIVSYLARNAFKHDFIYLSNVPDYLSKKDLTNLFSSCAERGAPVYLLLTSACADCDSVITAWEQAGYREHSCSSELTEENRGLGSAKLMRSWNRTGNIYLLTKD